jgi:hypothetical protein
MRNRKAIFLALLQHLAAQHKATLLDDRKVRAGTVGLSFGHQLSGDRSS